MIKRNDNNLEIHLQLAGIIYCQMVTQKTHLPTYQRESRCENLQPFGALFQNVVSLVGLTEQVLTFSCMAKYTNKTLTTRFLKRRVSYFQCSILQKSFVLQKHLQEFHSSLFLT